MTQIYILKFLLLTLPHSLLGNTDILFEKQAEVISQHYEILSDSCIIADKIKEIILGYLNKENELIYTKEFITYFQKNHKLHTCFFPRNNDETNLYFKLSDSLLNTNDKRATRLLIDLYLVNWINVEFSEHFAHIIPKAAITNLTFFVDVLSLYSEKDINKCVSPLKYLNKNEKESMKKELSNIKNPNQQMIIDRIKKIITST